MAENYKWELDPQSGEFRKIEVTPETEAAATAQATTQGPISANARSWFDDEEDEGWKYKFKTREGATVFGRYPRDLENAKAMQKKLLKQSLDLNDKAKAYAAVVEKEETTLPAFRLVQIEEELTRESDELRAQQRANARKLVNECVVKWEGGPAPFSRERLAKLNIDMCVEWATQIIQNSHLSEDDAAFLSRNSESGCTVAPPSGEGAGTSSSSSATS